MDPKYILIIKGFPCILPTSTFDFILPQNLAKALICEYVQSTVMQNAFYWDGLMTLMTWGYTSISTPFQSYQEDGWKENVID